MSNMLPSPDVLNSEEYGKFVLSNLAAKRAKQIKDGAPPLVNVESGHPLTIALAEIAEGKIKPIMQTAEEAAAEALAIEQVSDEPLPAELGMLLPALDETEAALIETDSPDEDHDHDAEPEAEAAPEPAEGLTLSDLAGDEDEESEPAPVVSEEDTLSLTDIAEQETTLEDEDEESEP